MTLVAPSPAAPFAPEDSSKKIRKPYTITKSRESWTDQEHDKFLEALQLFDRDWKKIESFIGTKNVIQIRSHAQKYFLKVQKNGTGEHVPPPRPKRKSAQPYPQKSAKSAPAQPSFPRVHTTSTPECDVGHSSMKSSYTTFDLETPTASFWTHHVATSNNTHWKWNATPDFTEIYTFLGNVFDPDTTEHLDKLKEMSCIDRETILLLMRNLSINLSSTEVQEHKCVSPAYDTSITQPLSAVISHA